METLKIKTKDLERELHTNTEKWVNSNFNFINVNVYDKMCDNMLFEYIRQIDIDFGDFFNDYCLWDEYNEHLSNNQVEDNDENKKDFAENHEHFEEFRKTRENDNYPMWNTLFEFRHEPSEELIQKCIDSGFGVIEGMEDFNTTLFVSGCGYSFYAQHWIPLYLSLEYVNSEKYKNVEFKHL